MVTEAVVVLLHIPFVNVKVTVYVPGVLVVGVMAPVAALMVNPAVLENVPPAVPVLVTVPVPVVVQNGLALYAIVATGSALIVTVVVAIALHSPLL